MSVVQLLLPVLCEHPPHLLAYADFSRHVVVCGVCGTALDLDPLPPF